LELFGVLFAIFFVFVFINIIRGFWMTSRISGKVFDLVERQLDQQLTEREGMAASTQPIECSHCGSSIAPAKKCPNCGADVA
jgi:predicted Zn-ribbon and HTH transcriptional regulator